MSRLPAVSGDSGAWGTVLNDFLGQSLSTDGSIKGGAAAPYVDVWMPAPNGTDDTTAIQAVINASPSGATIRFRPGIYLISAPIVYLGGRSYVGSGYGYGGTGTTIQQKSGSNITNSAGLTGLLVSDAWYHNYTSCDSPVYIANFYLDGNGTNNTGSTACGIVLCNFWSLIESVQVGNAPQHGIHLTDLTADGTTQITNSASENRINNCRIVSSAVHGISQVCRNGHSNQDGFCVDNIVTSSGGDGINFERAAGWTFRRNHLYGVARNGIYLVRCYSTVVETNYIEDFGNENTAGTYYYGIGVWQLDGYGTSVRGNTVGCSEPAGTATFVFVGVTAHSSQTAATTVVTDNSLSGNGTAQAIAFTAGAQGSGGTLGVLKTVSDNNQITNIVNSASIQSGAATVSGRTYGNRIVDGSVTARTLVRTAATIPSAVAVAGASNAGTSPPSPIVTSGSTNMAGSLTFGTGSSAVGTGAYVTVTFSTAFAVAPVVILTATNQATAIKQSYVLTVGASSFQIGLGVAGAISQANTVYSIAWQVVG